jgi:membrane protein required for beta-lactamase induction
MGLPYSKQINEAFDQVTPLVAEGFKVLETTKNISILLAAVQVITVFLLSLILCVLIALLITTNPDLERERRAFITPLVKWFTDWLTNEDSRRYLAIIVFMLMLGGLMGAAGGFWLMRKSEMEAVTQEAEQSGLDVADDVLEGEDGK